MARKAKTADHDTDRLPVDDEFIEQAEEVQPVEPATAPLKANVLSIRPGWVNIRKAGTTGRGIMVHGTQYGAGRVFTPDVWELIAEGQKKT